MRIVWMLVFAAMLSAGAAGRAWAQPAGPGAGPGAPPSFDPAQFRQMMMDRMREQLGASDDEWKVLQPKVEAVMKARQDARGGGMFMGPPPGGQDDQQSAVQKAAQELRQALEKQDTPMAQVQQRLAAYREARDAARKQLQNAQKALQELLTARQEAVLVQFGMLE